MSAIAAVVLVVVVVGYAGARLFKSPRAGIAIGALTATMPVLIVNREHVPASLPALLAVIGWLLAVDAFERTGRVTWLASAGAILGLATGVSGTALVTMPLLLVVTLAVLMFVEGERPVPATALLVAAGAFTIAIQPVALYLAVNPDWYQTRVVAHSLYDVERFNPLQGAREVFSWVGITERSAVYWHYLDPSFLFLPGQTFREALTEPRVFLLPFLVLLPLEIARRLLLPQRLPMLIVAGFLAAPVAGAIIGGSPVPARLVLAAPFAALLAYGGLAALLESPRRGRVIAGSVLAAAVVGQAIVLAMAD